MPVMSDSAAVWVQALAGVVQAFAALITLVLTVVLIRFTRRATESAERQSREAARQVDEAVRAREASFQPYVHVTDAAFEGSSGVSLKDAAITIDLANIGTGPAFGLRGRMIHPWLTFEQGVGIKAARDSSPFRGYALDAGEPMLLAPGADEGRLRFPFTSEAAANRSARSLSDEAIVRIEYRDIGGRWWMTKTVVHFDPPRGPEEPPVVGVVDQEERVERIGGPQTHRSDGAPPARPPGDARTDSSERG